MKYSLEETNEIIRAYKESPTVDTIDALALKLNRTKRSIISKLSTEGAYHKKVYLTKTGERPISKFTLAEKIAEILGLEEFEIEGLAKANKITLKKLLDYLKDA